MAKGNNEGRRVRWTEKEKLEVLRSAVALRAAQPSLRAADIAESAQQWLADDRKRPARPPLVSWMNQELRRAGGHVLETAGASLPQLAPTAIPTTAESVQTRPPANEADVEPVRFVSNVGAAILVGILRDSGVRHALAAALTEIAGQVATMARFPNSDTAVSVATDEPEAVLILGLPDTCGCRFGSRKLATTLHSTRRYA